MGAKVRAEGNRIIVHGTGKPEASNRPIDCGESGTTLRFLTAISASSTKTIRLRTSPRLASRPLEPLVKALRFLGADIRTTSSPQGLEILIRGPLRGGEVTVPGDISSQFISGLLLAAPLAARNVIINVEGQLESRPYVDMTIDVLKKHGIIVDQSEQSFGIKAPQRYAPFTHNVPADFSSAAFLIALTGTAGDEITISGIGPYDLEPDSAILRVVHEIGLEIKQGTDSLTIKRRDFEGFEFDARNNPDLVPPLEALGCFAKGSSEIRGVKRLVYKESDRLHSLPTELRKMGAKIEVDNDCIKIQGGSTLAGSNLDSHNDHRIVMACATASLGASGESIIHDSQVVSKSYPDFFQDLTKLGGKLVVE